MQMVAADSSEILVTIQQTTLRHTPEDCCLLRLLSECYDRAILRIHIRDSHPLNRWTSAPFLPKAEVADIYLYPFVGPRVKNPEVNV